MLSYRRLQGGYTDRGDHIDSRIGHLWADLGSETEAPKTKCELTYHGYMPGVHSFQRISNHDGMCDKCYQAHIRR